MLDGLRPTPPAAAFAASKARIDCRPWRVATQEITIASRELTAETAGMPVAHRGETAFQFELRFNKEPAVGFGTLRDMAFEMTGGSTTKARRLARGSNLPWEITESPTADTDVVLALPVTADCGA